MTSKEFVVWLQGFAELNEMGAPSESQWRMICERLDDTVNSVADPTVSTKNDSSKAVDAGMWADNTASIAPAIARTRTMASGGMLDNNAIVKMVLGGQGPEATLASASAISSLSTRVNVNSPVDGKVISSVLGTLSSTVKS